MSQQVGSGVTAASRSPRFGRVVVSIAAVVFVGLAAAGAAVARNDDLAYRSTAVLTIDQPKLIAGSRDAAPIAKLSELRFQYTELVGTSTLDKPIAEQVGTSEKTVADSVEALAIENSLLIVVHADSAKPTRATALAAATADQLIQYAGSSQDSADVPQDERIVLAVATPATPAGKVTRGFRTVATVALIVGILGAALVFALATLVRRRRR